MKKGTLSTILLILVLIIGLSLLLYPSFSNWWNDQHQTKAIANYSSYVAEMDEEDYTAVWESAIDYNRSLLTRTSSYAMTDEMLERYEQELNADGSGIIGYIEIPSISVYLPIYHGTDDNVLQVAVGHIDWSSLPTGGESTHCVLSGHRGLPSAKLFTDLDELVVGDTFILRVLDEVLTYEVDQILIVEPEETDSLLIEEGKDLCTLVTCTPYGINTHRLLVRGHRVENAEEVISVRVTADAVQVEPLVVAAVVLVPVLTLMVVAVLLYDKIRNRKRK